MKITKGLALLFTAIILGSCFDPPEFPNVPEISFENVEFFDGEATDSLVIYITFKDGDGDLGLSGESLEHISDPYHNRIFYQTTGNGQMIPLSTQADVTNNRDTVHILNIPDASQGDLVFVRTRKQPGYGFLPQFVPPVDGTPGCISYSYLEGSHLLVHESKAAALDQYVRFTDTLRNTATNERVFEILDTLYYTRNPNHFNIDVDFLIKDPASTHPDHPGYTEYDWFQEFCISFDGRFPPLSDNEGALEGTLRYSMNSLGFNSLFGLKTLRLRVQIRDRALNVSNVAYSRDFTLDQI